MQQAQHKPAFLPSASSSHAHRHTWSHLSSQVSHTQSHPNQLQFHIPLEWSHFLTSISLHPFFLPSPSPSLVKIFQLLAQPGSPHSVCVGPKGRSFSLSQQFCPTAAAAMTTLLTRVKVLLSSVIHIRDGPVGQGKRREELNTSTAEGWMDVCSQ